MGARMVYAAQRRLEPEPLLPADQRVFGHAAVLQIDLRDPGPAVPHHGDGLARPDARRAGIDREGRDTACAGAARARHDQKHVGVRRVGDVALGAVQHIARAVAHRRRREVGRIGAVVRFGQREGAGAAALGHGGQVFPLLRLRGEIEDRLAAKPDRGREAGAEHGRGLREREGEPHLLLLAEAQPAILLRDRDGEEAHLANPPHQVVGHMAQLFHPLLVRDQLLARKRLDLGQIALEFRVPVHDPPPPLIPASANDRPWSLPRHASRGRFHPATRSALRFRAGPCGERGSRHKQGP